LWYKCTRISGIAKPTLATWLIFCVSVTLSFITYRCSKQHNLLDNLANLIDLFFVGIITVTIVFVFINKHVEFRINTFEVGCIISTLIIVIFWIRTNSHEKANMFLQALMVVAYFPMIYQLWYATKNIEPLAPWFINLLAALCYVIIAIKGKNKLAIIYSIRMFIMLSIVISLIIRTKYF
jgi:hypothetical protein